KECQVARTNCRCHIQTALICKHCSLGADSAGSLMAGSCSTFHLPSLLNSKIHGRSLLLSPIAVTPPPALNRFALQRHRSLPDSSWPKPCNFKPPAAVRAEFSVTRDPTVPPFSVLITGSTKGIGYALAKEFLKAGDNVILCSRSAERVESAVESLKREFGEQRVWGTTCDVREGESVKRLVAFAQENLKFIDIWVSVHINNAGSNAYSYKPLSDASDEDLIEVVTTNTLGLMICCREAINMMLKQRRGGHIFNIDGAGSDGRPTPRFAAYGATKRSVVHLTKSLQAELQMQDVKNVIVHNLSPGMVTTDLLMSGATTKQAKFFINVLAEPAEVVAEYLVPNIRNIISSGSAKPTYIRFLTGLKAYSQIFARFAFGARRNRYLLEENEGQKGLPLQGSLFSHLALLFLCLLLMSHFSNQLPDSQSQAIFTIQKLLSHTSTITSLDQPTDFCNGVPNSYMTILCYEDDITQVHFLGADGLPPLPSGFSMEALFEALVALPRLKVVTMVSLGLWGPLPPYISNCSSLEILNLSSNFLSGNIPNEVLGLQNLHTLILDHNMLTGQIPVWLSSQNTLTVLSLKNNSLSGPLPSSFSGLLNLRIVQLSDNKFSGPLPDLSSLTNLQALDVGSNSFGPQFPSLPSKLVTLILRKNKFRFGMNDNITFYYLLQRLDISANELVGRFPTSILSFPSISYLDISGNRLAGLLQENMSCGAQLKYVDLSSNILTGNMPPCLLRRSRKMVVRYRKNCLSNGHLHGQHPYTFCSNEALAVKILPHKEREKGSASKSVVAMSTVGAISLLGLALLVTRILFSRHSFKKPETRFILEIATPKYTSRQFSAAREICQMMKLGPLGLPAYRNFALEEIKEATENFDESMLIGEGSLGPVYKGKLANETFVAIRSLKMRKKHGIQTYTHHIELLSKLRHNQLVSSIGHCFECHADDSSVNQIHLVFEYIPNGTLRDAISRTKLSWPRRILAAIGVAKGIQFLQTGIMPGLFENNIKITDVLLDHSLDVKINRYSLPLLAENREPILPPTRSLRSKEKVKAMCKQNEKGDVYDFGVILLEIVTGRAITSANEAQVVRDLFQVGIKADKIARKNVVDPAVRKGCSDQSLKTVMDVCIRCVSSEPGEKPSIEDVIWNLQFAAQVQESWQMGDSPSPRKRGTPSIYLSY
ncbi:hypothetical protein V2J09_022301, partial [Rumex salicifolius]